MDIAEMKVIKRRSNESKLKNYNLKICKAIKKKWSKKKMTYGDKTASGVNCTDGQWWNTEIWFIWIGWHEKGEHHKEC